MNSDEFMTILESADVLTVSQSTVRRLIKARKLVAISVTGTGCIRLTRESVDAYKAQLLKDARMCS